MQRPQFARERMFIPHGRGNLHIERSRLIDGDKIDFQLVELADIHVIFAAEQFKIDHVFEDVAGIRIAPAKQIIPQADIHGIILFKRLEMLLAADVIAPRLM